MAIVNGSLQEGYKDAAWFAANPTLVLLVGQKVNLEQTGTYKLGDGTTQLSALSFLGGSGSGLSGLTTNKVLKATSSTTAGDSNITDDGTNVGIVTGNSQIYALPTEAGFYYFENNTGIVKVNDSGTYLQHDDLIDLNAPSVTKNGVEVATVNDIPSVAGLAPIASPTFTGTVTSPAVILSSETASTIASFDASKNIKSLDTATYPSLTELSYGKGVTSAIQTQLDGKLNAINMFLTGGNQSTTSNVSSNITDLVSTTLTASKRYRIHGVIKVGCNNTGGIRFQITLPSGASMDVSLSGSNTSNTTYINATITSSATLSAQVQSFNGSSILRVDGEISLGVTAGTIQFGFASGTNTQTSTVYQLGTQLTLTQIN